MSSVWAKGYPSFDTKKRLQISKPKLVLDSRDVAAKQVVQLIFEGSDAERVIESLDKTEQLLQHTVGYLAVL